MSRLDDEEFDKTLRDTLHGQLDSMLLSKNFEEHVLDQLAARKGSEAQLETQIEHSVALKKVSATKWEVFTKGRRRIAWLGTGFAVMLIGLITLGVSNPGNGRNLQSASHSVASVRSSAASQLVSRTSITSLAATLAPISSVNIHVTVSTASGAQGDTANNTAHFSAQTVPTGKPAIHPLVPLSQQLITFHIQLYNSSNSPIAGKDLQGMLFFLGRNGGLSPVQASDWEYFVNGPQQVIPPHQSVNWSFTPNPTPVFTNLNNRYIHLVWFLRQPNAAFPSLTMGTLPISVSHIHETVIGQGGAQVQFLRISATVTNKGSKVWDPKTSLAMLFFNRHAGAQLLGHGTYKYFDDITLNGEKSSEILPGHSSNVIFDIVGVPHTNMLKLPLRILLIARNQVGV